jgi:hypothetical protein
MCPATEQLRTPQMLINYSLHVIHAQGHPLSASNALLQITIVRALGRQLELWFVIAARVYSVKGFYENSTKRKTPAQNYEPIGTKFPNWDCLGQTGTCGNPSSCKHNSETSGALKGREFLH